VAGCDRETCKSKSHWIAKQSWSRRRRAQQRRERWREEKQRRRSPTLPSPPNRPRSHSSNSPHRCATVTPSSHPGPDWPERAGRTSPGGERESADREASRRVPPQWFLATNSDHCRHYQRTSLHWRLLKPPSLRQLSRSGSRQGQMQWSVVAA